MSGRYLIFWLTLLLLVISAFLVDEVIETFFLPLLFIYGLGWIVSFILKDKKVPGLSLMINILSIGVLGWVIYSMLNYYFFYEGIVRIIVTAIVIYQALLSFQSYPLRRLDSIQFFTIPVFVTALIFPPRYPQVAWPAVLILLYLSAAFVIIRLRLQVGLADKRLKLDYRPFLLLLAVLLISMLGARVAVEKFPASRKGLKFSLYPSLKKQSLTEDRYFNLQTKLVDDFTQVGAKDVSPRSKTIFLLSSLVKESAIVEEVARAKQGLISYVGDPGLGISDSQISGMLMTLNTYLKEKTKRQMGKLGKDIADSLNKNKFSVKEKAAVLLGLNRMTHSHDQLDIEGAQRKINEVIDKASQDSAVKEEVKEKIDELKDWRLLDIFTKRVEQLKEDTWQAKIDDDLQKEMIDLLKQIADMPGPSRISQIKDLQEKIESHKDAKTDEALELVSGYREVVDIYSRLMKDVKEGFLPEKRQSKAGLAAIKIMESIDISVERKELFTGQEESLKATAIFDDGSQEDLTSEVSWKVNDFEVAVVDEAKVIAKSQGTAELSADYHGRESNYIDIVVKEPKISSLVVYPLNPRLVMGKELKLEVRGYHTEFDYKDLTLSATWNIDDSKNLRIEKDMLKGIRPGKNIIYAGYEGLRSDDIEVLIKPSLLFILKRAALVTLGLLLAVFLALVILHARRKRRLKELILQDPRRFVDQIYDNARVVLGVFSMPQENRPFMEYAASVDKNTGLGKETFLRLTRIFTRAKYSSLELNQADAQEAIKEYNQILRALSAKQNIFVFVLKYIVIFFRRQPFFLTI